MRRPYILIDYCAYKIKCHDNESHLFIQKNTRLTAKGLLGPNMSASKGWFVHLHSSYNNKFFFLSKQHIWSNNLIVHRQYYSVFKSSTTGCFISASAYKYEAFNFYDNNWWKQQKFSSIFYSWIIIWSMTHFQLACADY